MVRYTVPIILKKSRCFPPYMEKSQAEYIRLKFGLTLKRIIQANKAKTLEARQHNQPDHGLIDSFSKLESSSGLRKATLIDFAAGKSNPTATTLAAILDALNINLEEFGAQYDRITEKEIHEHIRLTEKAKKDRGRRTKKRTNN